MHEAEGEEGADDRRALVRHPKVAQTDGEFFGFIKVRKEEDCIGDAGGISISIYIYKKEYLDSTTTTHNPPSRRPKSARQAKYALL